MKIHIKQLIIILFLNLVFFTQALSQITGGTITYVNNFIIHTFSTSGTFYTPSPLKIEYLVVGGGGGGGATDGPTTAGHYNGGGGGAGGMRTGTLMVPANSTYSVIVGAGGNSITLGSGQDGGASVFASITAAGGGGGGQYGAPGKSGGSGGGGGRDAGSTGNGNVPPTIPPQGNDGYHSGGGGGGAGAIAIDRDGGAGAASAITGSLVYYAGGGGGGEIGGTPTSLGGIGGGGAGRNSYDFPGDATNGTPNTGGGGGAAGVGYASGAGGSGIVIIRYICVPNLTASASPNTICAGESVTLSASGAIAYNWNTGAIISSIVVNPQVSTNYSVTGTDTSNCSRSTIVTVTVNACTSISQQDELNQSLSIYPNPNKGEFMLESTINSVLLITNSLGQQIFQQNLHVGKNVIQWNECPSGIYLARFDGSNKTVRIIKE